MSSTFTLLFCESLVFCYLIGRYSFAFVESREFVNVFRKRFSVGGICISNNYHTLFSLHINNFNIV